MRRFLIFAVLTVLVLGILASASGLALAAAGPLRPGSLFFSIQNYAEQTRARLTRSPTARALYYLELADRRTRDLVALGGGKHESAAITSLSKALDQASEAVMASPPEDADVLYSHLGDLAQRIESALLSLTNSPEGNQDVFAALQAKVSTLVKLAGDSEASQGLSRPTAAYVLSLPMISSQSSGGSAGIEGSTIDPRIVAFLPGSAGARHAFSPLTGQHASLDCSACHANGRYAGTPSQCEACHAVETPANHFSGDCAACHTSVSWSDVHFDHTLAGTKDCQSCHLRDKPDNHFTGQCSQCHSTSTWQNAVFNHQAAGATDCLDCHVKDKPANHFSGQCSQCHNTSNWRNAIFNHKAAGATDCQTCHSKDKPANHFSGQCSQCHNTSSWQEGTFNHQAVGATDCLDCHTKDKPANHSSGQCSQCHNTSDWSDATFDHQAAGATDCLSCHNKDRPDNHPSGQCSQCHNTSNWRDATFNHQAAGATDCQSCHSSDRPANHFSGQCSQCHNTSSWNDASLSHSFPMNHANANGDCSKCHPSGGADWTCYTCHDQQKMEQKHSEEGISNISTRCVDCHPNGREGEGGGD